MKIFNNLMDGNMRYLQTNYLNTRYMHSLHLDLTRGEKSGLGWLTFWNFGLSENEFLFNSRIYRPKQYTAPETPPIAALDERGNQSPAEW